MKKSISLLLLSYSLLLYSLSYASQLMPVSYQQIEDNLIVGVLSDNLGLRISSAYFLGEIKSEKAIIPLLKM